MYYTSICISPTSSIVNYNELMHRHTTVQLQMDVILSSRLSNNYTTHYSLYFAPQTATSPLSDNIYTNATKLKPQHYQTITQTGTSSLPDNHTNTTQTGTSTLSDNITQTGTSTLPDHIYTNVTYSLYSKQTGISKLILQIIIQYFVLRVW